MTKKTLFGTLLAIFLAAQTFAQQSGIPGDGIPDLYWHIDDFTLNTSVGPVSRPAGTLFLDTDGVDVVAVLVGGVSAQEADLIRDNGDFLLGSTASLPDPNAPPFFSSAWAVGQINNSMQWVRTFPLDTSGFTGVVGEYEDPANVFPNLGLGCFATNTFESVFENNGQMWQAVISTNDGDTYYTNVTFPLAGYGTPICGVPEPTALAILIPALLYAGSRKALGPTEKN